MALLLVIKPYANALQISHKPKIEQNVKLWGCLKKKDHFAYGDNVIKY